MEEARNPSTSESAVERDLYQHFTPNQTPRSEPDPTLFAFAQLAALRLDKARALVSFLDRTNQYILVEATRTSPIPSDSSSHKGEDGLFFGPTTLRRSQGLCGHALEVMSLPDVKAGAPAKSPRQSPLVIADVLDDAEYKHHPFITSHPSLRFYATMPLSTKSGFNIGTLSVMDDRPAEGLCDVEVEFLRDLAAAIMRHLETARANEGHRRSEKMIRGLNIFMDGRNNLDDWWRELGNDRPSAPTAQEDVDVVSAASKPGGQESAPRQSLPPNVAEGAAATHVRICPRSRAVGTAGLVPDCQESLKVQKLKKMFSRAGQIIQNANEVGGVLFLDTRVNTLSGQTASVISSEGKEASPPFTGDAVSLTTDLGGGDARKPSDEALAGGRDVDKRRCGVLGYCTGENPGEHEDGAAPKLILLTEAFLQSLIHKYPNGHIFNLGEGGVRVMPVTRDPAHTPGDKEQSMHNLYKKQKRQHTAVAENTEDEALLQMLPGTRSIAFVPLWDSHGEKWFAGSFMWTTQQTTRILTRTEDLNYLSAFGTSIMAEVTRLDVVDADRAKSDFISSISHELRSPLHGILASVEFLRETSVDMFQLGMVDTIERCGRTLLDTLQHVLDFSKINNFNTPKRGTKVESGGGPNEQSRPRDNSIMPSTLAIDVDISLLAEDVIDSVFAGHEFHGKSSFASADGGGGFSTEGLRRSGGTSEVGGSAGQDRHGSKRDRIEVIMDFDWRPSWTFNTQSGALRRVLMNLFGNALKYTSSGWIKISLKAEDIEPRNPSKPDQSVITISVRDSGKGISQKYLHSGLFVPFTQENPLNPGTGLGLSIILQIVRSLGGKIDVTSEQGVGTEVVVTLTMNRARKDSPIPPDRDGENIIQAARRKTSGLTIGLMGLGDNSQRAGSESALFLQASVEDMGTYWFGMKVVAPSTWKASPPDIYVADETEALHGAFAGVPTIVLCSHEALCREYSQRKAQNGKSRSDGLIHFVAMPCGPYKLAKAFAYCLGDASRLPIPLSPGPLSARLASPQSLFGRSPEGHMDGADRQSRDGFFPPVAAPGVDELLAQAADGTVSDEKKRKPKLLLVEDNTINLRLLSTFVRKNNYEYDTAENGLLALQAFQNAEVVYDIIFMDISMPVMDGIAATRGIRKLERDRRQKPAVIIALTGLGSAASQQEAFASGVDHFLTKPARFSDLQKIMNDWSPESP